MDSQEEVIRLHQQLNELLGGRDYILIVVSTDTGQVTNLSSMPPQVQEPFLKHAYKRVRKGAGRFVATEVKHANLDS